jgi:mRNA-degrading endonuclease RelE of RelBE toxin-antitoxin system
MHSKFQFIFSVPAEEDFSALPRLIQERIFQKLSYWNEASNPLVFAIPMTGRQDTYRFRVGDYRIIVKRKNDRELTILLILKIGHRSEVYTS